MARLPPEAFGIPARGAAMQGYGVWRWVNGKLIFQRWPRRQPTSRTADEAFNRNAFYWSTRIAPLMDTYQQEFSRALAKDSQLVVRDFLFISLFGRIGHMVRRDGKIIYSMAAMTDVSKTLDAVWQLKGGLLFRDETWWKGLGIGAPTQVLTAGADGLPHWQDPPASGGGSLLYQQNLSAPAANTGAFACLGNVWQISEAINVKALHGFKVNASGAAYKPFLAKLSLSGTTFTVLSAINGPAKAIDYATFTSWQRFPFTPDVAVAAGDYIFAGLIRTDGTGTTVNQLGGGGTTANMAPLPGRPVGTYHLATLTVAAGQTLLLTGASTHALNVEVDG